MKTDSAKFSPDPDAGTQGFLAAPPEASRYGGTKKLAPMEAQTIILASIPPGSRVLDVGCGEGTIAAHLRDKCGASVVGIEPQADRAETARAKGFQIITGFLSPELQPQLGAFDAVIFADVLEHMTDPYSSLRVAQAFLKPGGIILASVPNIAHWTVRLRLFFGRFDYTSTGIMDATHLRWFTFYSLRRLFESAGLHVEWLRGSVGAWMSEYTTMRPWKWVPRQLRNRLLMSLTMCLPLLFSCQIVVQAKKAP